MLKKDKFKELMPDVERIKKISDQESGKGYWEIYNEQGNMIALAFYLEVPETPPESDEAAEFDKYEVWGITSPELEMKILEIEPHPDGPENLWAEGVTEPEYAGQFLGLTTDDMRLSPVGKIDAVTDGTISSKLLAEAIRTHLEFMANRIGR